MGIRYPQQVLKLKKMKDPIKVTVTVEKEITDIVGQPIFEGSVLEEVGGSCRGVVSWIGRPGSYGPMFACVGDIAIETGAGTQRITNKYSNWRHVPHNDQTYKERFRSWQLTVFEVDECYSNKEE